VSGSRHKGFINCAFTVVQTGQLLLDAVFVSCRILITLLIKEAEFMHTEVSKCP